MLQHRVVREKGGWDERVAGGMQGREGRKAEQPLRAAELSTSPPPLSECPQTATSLVPSFFPTHLTPKSLALTKQLLTTTVGRISAA